MPLKSVVYRLLIYKENSTNCYFSIYLLGWETLVINYGMDKMKFGQAVLSGQRIRLVASLHSLANLRGVAKAEIKFAIEIEGEKKKALEGIAIFLYYFN